MDWAAVLSQSWLDQIIDTKIRASRVLPQLESPVSRAALQWNDEVLGGSGFVDWHPFQHPQLGPLEIGGWQRLLRNNAPPQLLEETEENMARFLLPHA